MSDAHLIMRAIEREQLVEKVHWIKDGETALNTLIAPENPKLELVFLDIMLPKITGLEILETLKEKNLINENLPIVVFSSSNRDRDIKRALANGAKHFLTKPSSYQDLKEALRTLFKQSLFKDRYHGTESTQYPTA